MITTVKIDSIAAGGDGVGRADGMVVFVPRTAPGDLVRAELEPKGRFARAMPTELLAASGERVEAPCRHYTRDACGGCQLQHMTYTAQLSAKQRIIRDALQRIGRREAPLPFIRPSPDEWRYRTKLTLAIRHRGSRWIAGLHRYDDPRRVFALADCPITQREVVRVWRDVLAASAHFPDARELRGSVRATPSGFTFVLLGATSWTSHQAFFDSVPALSALWWKAHGEQVKRLHTRAPNAQADGFSATHSAQSAGESGAAFAQINPAVAAEVHHHVLERTRAHAPAHVIDAYAGTGATSLSLHTSGVRVTAIELDVHAAGALGKRVAPPSLVLPGRVEEHIAAGLPADVVLLNPPRAGIAEEVARALEHASPRPRAVVYVSCNPATLARDLTRLQSYRIESLVAFDMFPQTAHVETVCELVPDE